MAHGFTQRTVLLALKRRLNDNGWRAGRGRECLLCPDCMRERQHGGRRIYGKEVAFDGWSWGMFWIGGQKPKKKQLMAMLATNKFGFESEHSEING